MGRVPILLDGPGPPGGVEGSDPTFRPPMSNPPIHIIVERGFVTLTGVVSSEVDKALARVLAHQFGARSVTMQLKTDAEVRSAELGDPRHDDTD